jgi:hypothetical protein
LNHFNPSAMVVFIRALALHTAFAAKSPDVMCSIPPFRFYFLRFSNK